MRLKLIMIASLLAAIVGSGTAIGVILAVSTSLKPLSAPGLLVFSTFIFPSGAVSCASIFVYRHTAGRRKLQATLTAILGLLLCFATLLAASLITAKLVRAGAQTIPAPRTAN